MLRDAEKPLRLHTTYVLKREGRFVFRRATMSSFKVPKNDNLESLDIEFGDGTGVVYAGQELKGKVTAKLGELMTIRSVRLRFLGRSWTAWPEDRYYQISHSNENVMCQAEEVYFDHTLILYDTPACEVQSVRKISRRAALHEGVYEYPFSYQIDIDCPSTFEGEHGYVRYLCCAIVTTHWKQDRVAKRAFTVVRPYDLNYSDVASIGSPVANETTVVPRTGCCLTRHRNEITMTVRLPKSGFVCGEMINIWANLSNNSDQKIKRIKARLVQRTKYKSKFRGLTRERVSYRTVAQVSTKEELGPRWALMWNQAHMRIPPIVPTLDGGICALIQVDYGLVYEAGSISLALPINIGTLPLKSAAHSLRNGYQIDFTNLNPSRYRKELRPLHPNWTKYLAIIPPPCYCTDQDEGPVQIRERADNEYVPGQLVYEPRYPYYAWPPKEPLPNDTDSLLVPIL